MTKDHRGLNLQHIGCCDSSPSQHASKHAAATGHPIIARFEPGEDSFFDYEKRAMIKGVELLPPHAHPESQPALGRITPFRESEAPPLSAEKLTLWSEGSAVAGISNSTALSVRFICLPTDDVTRASGTTPPSEYSTTTVTRRFR